MQLSQLLTEDAILMDLKARTREEGLGAICDHVVRLYPHLAKARDKILQKLLDREELEPTALTNGAAIPHCKFPDVKQPILTLARSVEGVPFGSKNGQATRLFFTVISPARQPALHLKVLAAVAHFLKEPQRVARVLNADSSSVILERIRDWDRES